MKLSAICLVMAGLMVTAIPVYGDEVNVELIEATYTKVGAEWGTRLVIDNSKYYERSRHCSADPLSLIEWYAQHPALSPDGKWIAFVNQIETGIVMMPREGGDPIEVFNTRTYEIAEDGRLILLSGGYTVVKDIHFTPDSQSIVFQHDECLGERVENASDPFSAPIPSIKSINIYTGEVRVLVVGGYDPCTSSNGRYITYIHVDPNIYNGGETDHNGVPAIYDTVTGDIRYLIDENLPDKVRNHWAWATITYHDPTFSPDGSHIIATRNAQLVKIPFEGGEIEQLTSYGGEMVSFWNCFCQGTTYSPDGRWVLFSDYTYFLAYDTVTKQTFNVITGEQVVDHFFKAIDLKDPNTVHIRVEDPCWSAKGDKFCYFAILYTGQMGIFTIYTCDFNPDGFFTSKQTLVENAKPSVFPVLRNYPNPFNMRTTIEFSLPEAGFVNLVIYNAMGQRVRELVSGNMGPGYHTVPWDGCDDSGAVVSSGIFVSRLETGGCSVTNRMMLVK